MSTFVKEYEQLFNILMNLQTKKASAPAWVDMIDLGASFSPCFDTLEDLGRACQTRNLAFCPVTFETSDEWGIVVYATDMWGSKPESIHGPGSL